MTYLALCLFLIKKIQEIVFQRLLPVCRNDVVNKVHVDAVHIKPLQLLVEVSGGILLAFQKPCRHLVRQNHLLTVSVLEGHSNYFFAHAPMICIGCVYVVYSVIYGISEKSDSFISIHLPLLVLKKSHDSHTDKGILSVKPIKLFHQHFGSSLFQISIYYLARCISRNCVDFPYGDHPASHIPFFCEDV